MLLKLLSCSCKHSLIGDWAWSGYTGNKKRKLIFLMWRHHYWSIWVISASCYHLWVNQGMIEHFSSCSQHPPCAPTFYESFVILSCLSDSCRLVSLSPLLFQILWLPLKLNLIDATYWCWGDAAVSLPDTFEPTETWKRRAGAMPGGPFVQRRFMPCVCYFTSLSTQCVIDLRYESVNDLKAVE